MQYLKSSSPEKVNFFIQNLEEKKQLLEKQFYKIHRSFIIISQIFLSAPMGLQKPKRNWRHKDVILNRLHIVWCWSVYAWFAYCTCNEFIISAIVLPIVQRPMYCSEYLIYLITLLEPLRMIHFRRDTFRYFQMCILKFDMILLEMKVHVHYDDLRKFLCLHKALILLHFILCAVICFFYSCREFVRFISFVTVYILPNVIINISLLQYYSLLFLVYERGEKLHFHLNQLLNTSDSNDIPKFRQELNLIRNMFAKLDRLTKTINDQYSIFICLVYFGSFVIIIVNLFLLYRYWNVWSDTSNPAWIVFSLTWTVINIARMVLILYHNQKVQNMKSKATLLLSSFKFEYPGAESTLRLFILQLMSDTRSNYVCGLIALNMNFITSLAVAISALFIFLVQYDITFEALMSTLNSGRPK